MSDIIKIEKNNVNSKGYGIIPKLVMQDKKLNIISKGIYAYFKSFVGSGETCFPTKEKMCDDLGISKDTLNKYIKPLCYYKYISIEQARENGKFSHNIYVIHEYIIEDENTVYENTGYGNLATNNNNIINNNNNKNNSNSSSSNTIYDYLEENFGRTLSSVEFEEISTWEDNELTRYAIKQAVLNGKFNITYISRILFNYKKNNISTVQQAQLKEQQFRENKNTNNYTNNYFNNFKGIKNETAPNWMFEEPESKEATPEEIAELERQLENI